MTKKALITAAVAGIGAAVAVRAKACKALRSEPQITIWEVKVRNIKPITRLSSHSVSTGRYTAIICLFFVSITIGRIGGMSSERGVS